MGDSAIDALDALLSESGVQVGEETRGDSGGSGKIANYVNLMKKVPLLRSLTEEEQRKIAALLKPVEFEDGDKIVTQGEEGDSMYFVESGQAEAVVDGVGVVMEYSFGGFFGELALRSNQPRAATVQAKGFSTTVLQLPRPAFDWLMKQKTDLAKQLDEQSKSYAGSSFDVEESAGAKGTAAMSKEELKELADAQGLEIHMLKAENLELLKEVEELREKTTKLQAENSAITGLLATGDDELDGET